MIGSAGNDGDLDIVGDVSEVFVVIIWLWLLLLLLLLLLLIF